MHPSSKTDISSAQAPHLHLAQGDAASPTPARVFDDGGVGEVGGQTQRKASAPRPERRSKDDAGGSKLSDQPARASRAAREVVDRRLGVDRRDLAEAVGQSQQDKAQSKESADVANPFDEAGFERRRGAGRRLADHLKDAEEGELSKEQFLFLMAIESFKKANQKMFPAWTDVLEVVRLLGYRKTMPMELKLSSAEDWQEAADTPSNVRAPRWQRHDPRSKAA
jgi:hypothetical protein